MYKSKDINYIVVSMEYYKNKIFPTVRFDFVRHRAQIRYKFSMRNSVSYQEC